MINIVLRQEHEETNQDINLGRGGVLGNPFTHRETDYVKDNRYLCRDREEVLRRYKKYINYFLQPVFDSDDERIKKQKEVLKRALNDVYKRAKYSGVNLVCDREEEFEEARFIQGIVADRLYYTEEDKLVEFLSRNQYVETLVDKFDLIV